MIEILHQVAPGARRIAFMLNENNPNNTAFWSAAMSACAALQLVAQRIVASAPAQLDAAVAEIVRQRSQAVVVVADPMYFNERARLHALLQGTRLPVAYSWRENVVGGGLLSYGVDVGATYRRVAAFVDKILSGAKPAELPVEQVNKFDLAVNVWYAERNNARSGRRLPAGFQGRSTHRQERRRR